ncbi:hypothetical protein [Lacrimispora sp.]|uniref:hypothetical protein n=1 Tax=Lacrimispora sp. TaxID=2719234 RepID=UPI002899E9D5|nr:hypothetical protein [Lacrimispora sp.]
MEFTFLLSRYEEQSKLQLFYAYKYLTEMKSRKATPNIWKVVDRLEAVPKVSKSVSEKRRKRYKLYGAFLIILGLFAIIPSFMAPKELLSVLIASIVALLLGFIYLFQPKINSDKNLQKKTDRIWSEYQIFDEIKNSKVVFRDTGIYENEIMFLSFSDLLQAVFCQDIILFIGEKGFVLLQKKDLQNATMEQFLDFIERQSNIEVVVIDGRSITNGN